MFPIPRCLWRPDLERAGPRVHPQRNRHRPRSKGMKRFIPPRTRHARQPRPKGVVIGYHLHAPDTHRIRFEGPLRRVTVGHYAHPRNITRTSLGVSTPCPHQTDTPRPWLRGRSLRPKRYLSFTASRCQLSSRSRSSVSRTEQQRSVTAQSPRPGTVLRPQLKSDGARWVALNDNYHLGRRRASAPGLMACCSVSRKEQ